jgi:hypothetical protein
VSNARALRRVLDTWSQRFGISLERLSRIQDQFLTAETTENFLLWYSLILRADRSPVFKAYLNPQVHGPDAAPGLVADALRRLNFHQIYPGIREHALRRGDRDKFTFLAVDLHDRPGTRVKAYVAHEDATAEDAVLAASAVPGVDPRQVGEFCAALTDTDRFSRRPLLSSYVYLDPRDQHPSGYSLYLPIRDYVDDDEQTRRQLRRLLTVHGYDSTVLDRAIAAITDRPLAEGVGLLAHVSLRLGLGQPGITVYLSSEAYSVTAPRVPDRVH